MTGSKCRRLLAVFSLIFVAPAFSPGQDAPVDRFTLAPGLVSPPDVGIAQPIRPPVITVPIITAPFITAPQRYPTSRSPNSPGTTISPQVIDAAGIIFSGRVTFVGHSGSFFSNDAVSTTVVFQVEHAIRGTSTGQTLTIHEWSGLWARGERYRVGEGVLLFLYPPSKLGLTSPVGGAMGRFSIDPQGRIAINAQNAATFAADPLIGGRSIVPYADFARAVQRAGGEK
jgi:hypothetical protein